jgi:glycosyltransferase involved in cell wall biosynthesis
MLYSKSDKIKIAIVIPIWAPMRDLLFEELDSLNGVHLKVFFEKKEVPHRPSWKPISLRAYCYKIIHSYHLKWFKRYRLLAYRLPFYLKRYNPDVVVVVNLSQAVFALMYTLLRNKILILWSGESEHILTCRSLSAVWLIRRVLYPLVDGFGCYSKKTMSFFKDIFRIPTSKIFHIPQCVDQSHFMCDHEDILIRDFKLEDRQKKFIFLSVGQLIYLKGYDLLIKAWRKLPREILDKAILRIAGTGPLEGILKNLICRTELTNVELIGFVHYQDLPSLYRSADAFILPTREDTWGLVVNEAISCGLPVLCSKYAHAQEMIVEGENGYIFDPLDIEDTIFKIKTMYERRYDWIWTAGNAWQRLKKQYSVETAAKSMLEGIVSIYQKKCIR